MDITITGRHVPISDKFRDHVEEKLARLEQLTARDPRVDVVVTKQVKPGPSGAMTVEITWHVKGPVIRAESSNDDKYAAFDMAADKLLDRLKKANDRRRGKRRRITTSTEIEPPADILVGPTAPPAAEPVQSEPAPVEEEGPEVVDLPDTPIEVRVKRHRSAPMSLEQALYEMEMVGHDFYLFTDAETGLPSVLYRRRGWSYGVLHLEGEPDQASTVEDDLTA